VHEQALIARAAGDRRVNRAELARELGMSRQWLSTLIGRFEAEQFAGLEPRSRAPRRPAQTPSEIEELVVRWRKQLSEDGLDHGPETIRWHLARAGVATLPSLSTIWRICDRHGLVVKHPKRRPRASWVRFEHAAPNDCWQIDCTYWRLGRRNVVIVNVVDDHSRVLVASAAAAAPSCAAAFGAICAGAQAWGLPVMVLSDNGSEFTGAGFTDSLARLGVQVVHSRPAHPQTCGKVERFHQTLKRWLARQPSVRTIGALQAQLNRFAQIYNHERPHRSLARDIPASRWSATPASTPGPPRLDPDQHVVRTTAGDRGSVNIAGRYIALGTRWASHPVVVFIDDLDYTVFTPTGEHIRTLRVDPNRRYQPLTNT
jgi:transposase InsO family protein